MDLFSRYAQKETRRVIGLMSGTSADGIDVALARVSGSGQSLQAYIEAFKTVAYDPSVRQAIMALFAPDAPIVDVCRMNFTVGALFGEAALSLLKDLDLSPAEIDLIASHGQTICHLAPGGPHAEPGQGATIQIGEPAVIAELTGITVAADFRARDMAAGGQGAPLVPYADYALFHDREKTRAVQNIGGIANVTFLPAGAGIEDVVAFDTGPGNIIVDALVSAITGGEMRFDEDGALGALGQVDDTLLGWFMAHEFIAREPPKSTGREEFGGEFLHEVLRKAEADDISAEDLLATATAFTAESIAVSYGRFLSPGYEIDEVILGGGGSYNATLRRMLRERLPTVDILLHEDFGIRSDAKEALAFALLGNETMLGRPANVPSATGARHAVILGKITPA